MRGFIRVVAGVLAGLMCLAGTTGVAFAGGYGAVAGQQSGGGSAGGGGTLPFTGLDLAAYVVVAVAIVAAGIGLRSLAGRGTRI